MSGGDGIHHPIPDTCFSPSHEAIVAGGAGAVAFGKVTPRSTRAQHPEDAVQDAAVVDARHASRLVWQQWLDHTSFEVGKIISAHWEPESEHNVFWKPLVNGTLYKQDALSFGRYCHREAVARE